MEECEFVFNILCASVTSCSTTTQFECSFTGIDSVPYERSKKSRGGGVLIFIKKSLLYKIRKDRSESDEHKEILSLRISYKNSSNIPLSCCYKPPKADNDILSMFLKQVFKKPTAEKKPYYLIEDLNINCLEYFEDEKVSTFYNLLFEYGAVALINKTTHVARKSTTITDNVITTYFRWVFKKKA